MVLISIFVVQANSAAAIGNLTSAKSHHTTSVVCSVISVVSSTIVVIIVLVIAVAVSVSNESDSSDDYYD